jgi:hypothetical protein
MSKLIFVLTTFLLIGCASETKQIENEVSHVKPKTRQELVKIIKTALETSKKITKKEKEEFLAKAQKNMSQREVYKKENQKLLTLLIEHGAEKDYSLSKIRKIIKKIKKNELKVVDLKITLIEELKIFCKEKLAAEERIKLDREVIHSLRL